MRKLVLVLVILQRQQPLRQLWQCSARMLESHYQLECGLSPALSAYAAAYSTGSPLLHEIHPGGRREHEIVNKYMYAS